MTELPEGVPPAGPLALAWCAANNLDGEHVFWPPEIRTVTELLSDGISNGVWPYKVIVYSPAVEPFLFDYERKEPVFERRVTKLIVEWDPERFDPERIPDAWEPDQ